MLLKRVSYCCDEQVNNEDRSNMIILKKVSKIEEFIKKLSDDVPEMERRLEQSTSRCIALEWTKTRKT